MTPRRLVGPNVDPVVVAWLMVPRAWSADYAFITNKQTQEASRNTDKET
ncbi:MAG: hypothetical protein ABI725_06800 [Chloroflexota bacterium]